MTKRRKPKIRDVGEKIGGARKDLAVKTGPRQKRVPAGASSEPAWARRYIAMQSLSDRKWYLHDAGRKGYMGHPRAYSLGFDSEAAANAAKPLAAVSRQHVPRFVADGKYEIWRKVTDRKSVKVVDQVFASRDDAMRHMATNAAKILETKTSFGEEILAKPDRVFRTGPKVRKGEVKGSSFAKAFGFRGVEFGNWNSQVERQAVLNHAFDAMHDLSRITGVDPKSLTFNERLALAFGARGSGLSAARAHYERDYTAMNLTKMKGAGHLAHEWMHGLDHWLGRVDDPKLGQERVNRRGDKVLAAAGRGEDFASHRVAGRSTGQLDAGVRSAYKELMDALYYKEEQFTEDRARVEKFAAASETAVKERLASIRRDLAEQRDPRYSKRNYKPATAAQLKKFDKLAAKITSGEALKTELRSIKTGRSRWGTYRHTNEALEGISSLIKEVRGRTGFDGTHHRGPLDELASRMRNHEQRLQMVAEASAQSVKTRKVPTSFAMDAKRIDQGRASDYWSTRHEMVARAFSSYVEDKAKAQGIRSDFLSYGSRNDLPEYRMLNVRPFPEGGERQAINAKFDKFFSAMREAELVKPAPTLGAPAGWSDAAREASAKARKTSAVDKAYQAHLEAIRDTSSDPKTKASKIASTREALQQAQHDERAAKRQPKPAAKPGRKALQAEAKELGIKGRSRMKVGELQDAIAKAKAPAKSASVSPSKLGLGLTVAGPALAALVAYDSTKSQALAAGKDNAAATTDASINAAVAGGGVAGVGYGISKGIAAASKVAPIAGKVLARAVPVVAVGFAGYEAYKGYQKDGLAGAGDALLDFASLGAYSHFGAKEAVHAALTPNMQRSGGRNAPRGRAYLNEAAAARSSTSSRVTAVVANAQVSGGSNGWVAGYTRADGVRVAGYRRK